jgi:hypothetical protein
MKPQSHFIRYPQRGSSVPSERPGGTDRAARSFLFPALLVFAWVPVLAQQTASQEMLKPYLADIGPGPIAANEMLGMSTAVTSLQTAKDVVGAINLASADGTRNAFAVSFSPARSDVGPLSVSLAAYTKPSSVATRLWGGTVFSYAQSQREVAGAQLPQKAWAVHTSYYLRPEQDPIIAAAAALATCQDLKTAREQFANEILQDRVAALRAATGRAPNGTELEQIQREIRDNPAGPIRLLKAMPAVAQACVQPAVDAAAANWRASRVGLTLGQGWITPAGANAQRQSLGRHLALAVAYGPADMPNSLFNLTLRRVDRETDLSQLASVSPDRKASTLAALRFTYGWGDKQAAYVLAEVSNARSTTPTLANSAFKHALGVDYKVGEGMWLEFRHGRSRVLDSGKLENKSILSFKIAPAAWLPGLVK